VTIWMIGFLFTIGLFLRALEKETVLWRCTLVFMLMALWPLALGYSLYENVYGDKK
jgi:steroid 5-alpha reductase family enzyme